MTTLNPLIGAALAPQIQQRQVLDRDRQIRRTQELTKNAALQGDELEHQVESSDTIHATQDNRDETHPHPRKDDPPPQDDDVEHIDVTA